MKYHWFWNKRGVNIYYSGSEVDVEWKTQVILLEEAIEHGADSIITAPYDSSKLAEQINTVYASSLKELGAIFIEDKAYINIYNKRIPIIKMWHTSYVYDHKEIIKDYTCWNAFKYSSSSNVKDPLFFVSHIALFIKESLLK